ncbi:MAG: DUF2812 domain-containing protein [Faecalibacterium sp.]
MNETAERKTVHRWIWVWNFDKEERWLNSMAMSGWALEKVGFCTYHFVRCEPGEYTIRMGLFDLDNDYHSFLQEMGAEYIGNLMKWQYYRKKAADGPFELFSDLDSRIQHLKRISRMLGVVCAANIIIGVANSMGHAHTFAWANLLCASLLAYALGRIHGKQEGLESERLLHE